ncbi:helix-turn-helix domain-containing protein [Paenibacillus sp. SEL3]
MDPIKVLIVDDEPRICRGVERLVTSLGKEWVVTGALGDGRQALAFLDSCGGDIDLLITDIRMPEMDGLTMFREAMKQYKFFTIFLTGYDDFEYMQSALRSGAADYLLKPIDREQFAVCLETMKTKIKEHSLERYKRLDLEKKGELLVQTRQTQTLAYITAADTDLTHLGYWVDMFPEGWFLLLYTSLDAMPVKTREFVDRDWKAYFYALENIITEVTEESQKELGGLSWVWKGQHSEFWVLLALPDKEPAEWIRERVEKAAERICQAVRKFTPFTVSIAYSDWIEDLYVLPIIKRQCLAAIQQRLLKEGNRVFRFENSGEKTCIRNEGEDLTSLLQRIKRSIEQADVERTESECRQLFKRIEEYSSPYRIRETAANLMLLIHSTLLETCGEQNSAKSVETILQAIQDAVNLSELRRLIIMEACWAAEVLAEARTKQNVNPLEAAKAWIQENLGSNITIKKIADAVHMNPTYFCEYFKLQTGETVLEYVTWIRMEQAAKLLQAPKSKLQEVSCKVGYQDVKYFSRLFKRHFGLLPSHYRDSRAYEIGETADSGEQM